MCGVDPARASVVVAVVDALSRSVSGIILLSHQSMFVTGNAPLGAVFRHGFDQTAGTVAASKNNAWAIAAFTVDRWNGLVMRNVGSGRVPVRRRSGNAVMKITGTENSARMSLTASIPLESSAS